MSLRYDLSAVAYLETDTFACTRVRSSSNGGVFGSLFGTPIINLPQAAVLGTFAMLRQSSSRTRS